MDVVSALKSVAGVNSADPVTGAYDVIAIIEGVDINAVGNLVAKKVHTVSGVLRTVTCFAMSFHRQDTKDFPSARIGCCRFTVKSELVEEPK
jgi:DNA-binding Lrp family transcriptional regulator